jgi:hypothetical protein
VAAGQPLGHGTLIHGTIMRRVFKSSTGKDTFSETLGVAHIADA